MNPAPFSFVQVLLPRPFDHGFDYLVPAAWSLEPGDFVEVPFGNQRVAGVVWGAAQGDVPAEKCKSVLRHYQHVPPCSAPLRDCMERMARYTLAPLGLVLKLAMPSAAWLAHMPEQEVFFVLPPMLQEGLTSKRQMLRQWLALHPGATRSQLGDAGFSAAVLKGALASGIISVCRQPVPPKSDQFIFAPAPALNDAQQQAACRLREMVAQRSGVLVLDGVTGSGKTEVYFDAIEAILRESDGGQVLVLLPEIALTHQWLARCEARFGLRPHLWHSSLPEAQRRDSWRAVATGAARLVVGARSALFLPFVKLALMVVDEEHEASYKQEDGVSYQARDMAVLRASIEKVPIVLASATPSMETVYNIQQQRYDVAALPSRFGAGTLPEVRLVDSRSDKPERGSWLTPALREALVETLAKGEQALLFLNRRGYAPLLLCRACGHRFQCLRCSAWMVVHQHPARLQCHHCDARQPYPQTCPACHAPAEKLVACGPGVQRLHEDVAALFPQARVAALTSDDVNIAQTLQAVADRGVDILIGTQMVAKGHHFPHLTLVGVVDADLGLTGGDLRAAERTYQLLHQVAGRAGRESAAGRVLIQTSQPDHPVMQALAAWDRDGFIAQEMHQRAVGGWPPFGRLAALVLDGPREMVVAQAARQLAQQAAQMRALQVLGPTPAPLSRLKGQYRYRLLIKTPRDVALQPVLRQWLSGCHVPKTVRLKVDIDPYYFL